SLRGLLPLSFLRAVSVPVPSSPARTTFPAGSQHHVDSDNDQCKWPQIMCKIIFGHEIPEQECRSDQYHNQPADMPECMFNTHINSKYDNKHLPGEYPGRDISAHFSRKEKAAGSCN